MATSMQLGILALAGLGACGIVLETTPRIPDGWNLVEQDVDPGQPLRLSIALREPNMQELRSKISGPSAALRVPDQDDVDAVEKWLSNNGITHTAQENDWIYVHTTVGEAETLLEMKMHRYQYENKDPVLRTREYSVPEPLVDAIKFVHPIGNFMAPKKELTRKSPPKPHHRRNAPCAGETTPKCIRKLYNMPPVDPNAQSSIRLGVAGFLEENANHRDVDLFLRRNAPEILAEGYNFTVELVNGGENSQKPAQSGSEAALDMDYTMALGFPSNITYYSTGGRGEKLDDNGDPYPEEFVDNEPYLELLAHLLDKLDDEIPHVLSFSYGDDELSVPKPYAERVCSMFGLLTARGTSILVGSGDGGAAGGRNSSCRTPDGMDVTMAAFPATCPWATAVGAVDNDSEPPKGADFSGGGFSQYFPREAWQDEAVEDYVQALGGHLCGYYNSSMRATPDISVVGTEFQTVIARQVSLLDGTSASTPVMAAMIALVNEERIRAGKEVLGWLNGKIYSKKVRETLQDISGGVSKSCSFENGGGEPGGWPAAEGWDAITGLGVPRDFQRFLRALVET
ncbi:hypothetical protein ACO1O0_004794 [Amphichorda felina]